MTNEVIMAPAPQGALTTLGPQPGHGLGPVADDWAAIEVWLRSVERNNKKGGKNTVETYRFHLAKLRWFCEQQLGRTPSYWHAQDAEAFAEFLDNVPDAAINFTGAKPGDADYRPFQKKPSESARSDILRFAKAMFSKLRGTGYIRLNPMELMSVSKERRLDKTRSVDGDLYDLVLQVIDETPRDKQKDHQLVLRDRFIFICLREAGLRTSELIGARMKAFSPLYDPKSGNTYWVLTVVGDTAKGGKERTVPVTPVLLDALVAYRRAFGLDPLPDGEDKQGLVLSVRTTKLGTGGKVKTASDRRVFCQWREVSTRQGLYAIVKGRVLDAVGLLMAAGDTGAAERLERVSAHWLRHTFAMASLLQGQDLRTLATSLGHASVNTTMVYTEQDALDQIRSWECAQPGSVAQAHVITV